MLHDESQKRQSRPDHRNRAAPRPRNANNIGRTTIPVSRKVGEAEDRYRANIQKTHWMLSRSRVASRANAGSASASAREHQSRFFDPM
jgi:hypothetical protein